MALRICPTHARTNICAGQRKKQDKVHAVDLNLIELQLKKKKRLQNLTVNIIAHKGVTEGQQ